MIVEHFELTDRKAIVFAADNPAGSAIADALEEAGAIVARIDQIKAAEVSAAVEQAAQELGGLNILACAPDVFLAKPVSQISVDELADVMMGNFAGPFFAVQAALPHLREDQSANIILVTSVLGERGLPNTSVYSAAHGAIFNYIRALAQELAPEGISVNGIELGWMDWMQDRLNPKDEHAMRALRFTMAKRAGTATDVGPLAVWLAGSGVGFVTGQVFPLDGGLTQHL
ncbi:MAG: SDR family oxidoreductase [Pseudomonadales bacterium]